jgi:phosphate transport system protein
MDRFRRPGERRVNTTARLDDATCSCTMGPMTDPAPDDPLAALDAERRQPRGNRQEFQEQLAELEARLVTAAATVQESIRPATQALLEADLGAGEDAVATIAELDRECADLEEDCYALIARQGPVAGDLRRVAAVLRSIADVQRSSQLVRHIVASLAWIHPPAMPEELRQLIDQLGDMSAEIFAAAAAAWETHDALAANDLDARDDQVDLLQKLVLTELYTQQRTVEEGVSLALVARYYERIADHAVAIAHQVAYFLTGERPQT